MFCLGQGQGAHFISTQHSLLGLFTASVSRHITVSALLNSFLPTTTLIFPVSVFWLFWSLLVSTQAERFQLLFRGENSWQESFLPLKTCRNDKIIEQLTVVCVILLRFSQYTTFETLKCSFFVGEFVLQFRPLSPFSPYLSCHGLLTLQTCYW